ncbi:MAG: Fe-S oxidoreductase [Gammaproteobacteria bacterium]|nr:Fe-S oxidoreductase [Gammaproteobacteria bacterium]
MAGAGSGAGGGRREGSLEAPTRHALNWREPAFYDEVALGRELDRVFEICHGCRRCFSLCQAFPTLFDAIDESPTGELDAVDRKVYWKVVDHCYLCDLCFMTKCPYVPPHEWNVDFPHLMLRAKAQGFRAGRPRWRDRLLSATDLVGRLAGIPVVSEVVNAANASPMGRKLLEYTLGVHPQAPLPRYHSTPARARLWEQPVPAPAPVATDETQGRVALFTTCYGNRNEPDLPVDLAAVFRHNGIEVVLVGRERCCGMPRLELGDLESVARAKDANVPELLRLIEAGYDIVAPIPSCVLMFKQELPLMFPQDADVERLQRRIFDPFEYLMLRHKAARLRTDFQRPLGTVSYHVPCHLRVQNIGLKTRDILRLIPDTTVDVIERCSGHDGTYAVKSEFREASMKIGRPVMQRVAAAAPDWYASDCPMAGHQIESGLDNHHQAPTHPLKLLRIAYGI